MKSRMFAFVTLLALMATGVAVAQTEPAKPVKPMQPAKSVQTHQAGKPTTAPAQAEMKKNMTTPAMETNIIQRAEKNADLSIFVSLVKEAGLTLMLSGKGPYTVFAPNDEAFKKLAPEQFAALTSDKARLADVLKHHIIEGKRTVTADMAKMQGQNMMPMNGPEIACGLSGESVTVGGAKIAGHDMMATNGVIHPIDTVLLLPTAPMPAMKAESSGK